MRGKPPTWVVAGGGLAASAYLGVGIGIGLAFAIRSGVQYPGSGGITGEGTGLFGSSDGFTGAGLVPVGSAGAAAAAGAAGTAAAAEGVGMGMGLAFAIRSGVQ